MRENGSGRECGNERRDEKEEEKILMNRGKEWERDASKGCRLNQ